MEKRLKTIETVLVYASTDTGLKPGVNEKSEMTKAFQQF
jgi:hypothetical protein